MKCNSYFEYSNGSVKCKIKVSNNAFNKRDTNFIIKFKKENEIIWKYHMPDKKFSCHIEVINYILNNLDNNKVKFKII